MTILYRTSLYQATVESQLEFRWLGCSVINTRLIQGEWNATGFWVRPFPPSSGIALTNANIHVLLTDCLRVISQSIGVNSSRKVCNPDAWVDWLCSLHPQPLRHTSYDLLRALETWSRAPEQLWGYRWRVLYAESDYSELDVNRSYHCNAFLCLANAACLIHDYPPSHMHIYMNMQESSR